jgi:tetratricopeptide (TPR) repeat protein
MVRPLQVISLLLFVVLPQAEGVWAQYHFLTSVDREVAAVGESFLLTAELLASPKSGGESEAFRQAFNDVQIDTVGQEGLVLIRSGRPTLRMSEIDGRSVMHLTRKFILKLRKPGTSEIPPLTLQMGEDRVTAPPHDVVVYTGSSSFHQSRRSILPLVVETRVGSTGDKMFIGTGSGFLVAEDALVTAYHVVVNADRVVATLPNGKRVPIKKTWSVDPVRDVAVLHIDADDVRDAGVEPLEIAPRAFRSGGAKNASREPEVVFTAGWPKGVQRSQAGVLFAVNRYYDDEAIWLSSNHVRPGDSGGPLLNGSGQVIGVISYAMSGRRSASELLENVATSTDPRPALARKMFIEKPVGLGRFRTREFFEREPHAMAAKVASLLSEFADPRGQAFIGGVDPLLLDLRNAVDDDREQPRLHFIQGSVYQMLGDFVDAKSAYEEALVRRSDHFPSAYSLAYCQLALRSYETAAELFSFISTFEPYQNLALYGLAQAEMQLLRYRRAVEHLTQVIHHHPDFGPAHFLLGRAYVGLGELDKAAQIQTRLEVVDERWAVLLSKVRDLVPLRPVQLYTMPEARLRQIDP